LRTRHGKSYRRRGVSTVVTSLLLVVAVGIIGTFLVSWANSSFAIQRANIADETSERINLVKEDLVIEDVWFYTEAGPVYFANVTIRNTGDLAVTISNIYVNNSQFWNTGETIPIDGKEEIKVPFGATPWAADSPQSIWVKTERGTEVKQVWKS
jgi:hypothetical protein